MMITKPVSVYILIDPIIESVFYVGLTVAPLKSRLSQHLHDCGNKNNKKFRLLNEIIDKGFNPEILEIDVVDFHRASFYEEFYIDLFISYGFTLYQDKYSTYNKVYKNGLPAPKPIKSIIKLQLEKDLISEIERIAIKDRRTPANLIETVLLDYIHDNLPEMEQWAEDFPTVLP